MICECFYEPRGDHGLEGYSLNSQYKCELIKQAKKSHWRVYPAKEYPEYYETCGVLIFKRYFKEVE